VSYGDFGFIRRGLVGTILSETGLNGLFSNEYVFALVVQIFGIAVLTALTAYYCITRNLTDRLFVFGIACSPVFIVHSGYTTGSLDVFVLILALLNTLYIRNIFAFASIVFAGIFTHEMFLFLLPAQLLALHLSPETSRWHMLFAALSAAIAMLLVFLFGRVSLPEPQYIEIMGTKMPNAQGQHSLWSGYYEVGSTVKQNLSWVSELKKVFESGAIFFLAPSLIYALLLLLRAMKYLRNSTEMCLFVVALAAPIFASLVATDFHRWTAMSANMGLLMTLKLATREVDQTSNWNFPIALFCLLAPFGGAELERPFPLHQFLLERFVL
jgi:hypothetical protein